MITVAKQVDAGSLHILFCSQEEADQLGEIDGLSPRRTFQFHWTHPGVEDFEQWLSKQEPWL